MKYIKINEDLINSSVWQLGGAARIVWVTILLLMDEDGKLSASVPGLARMANVDLDKCVEALELFQAPDQWNENQEHEGRRLRNVDGKWEVLDFERYQDERTKYQRVKQAEYRAKKKAKAQGGGQ